MNEAKWIKSLHGKCHRDLTLGEADDVIKMLLEGDLLHIDGELIKALADLADNGRCTYRDHTIVTTRGCGFSIRGIIYTSGAVNCLLEIDALIDRKKRQPGLVT